MVTSKDLSLTQYHIKQFFTEKAKGPPMLKQYCTLTFSTFTSLSSSPLQNRSVSPLRTGVLLTEWVTEKARSGGRRGREEVLTALKVRSTLIYHLPVV